MDTDELRRLPLFSSLSDADLKTVGTWASETSVAEGKHLVHQGDYAYELSVIASGTADVVKDGQALGTLKEGDVFGEMAVLEKSKRSADVIATSSMRLITLSNWDLHRMPVALRDEIRSLAEERGRANTEG